MLELSPPPTEVDVDVIRLALERAGLRVEDAPAQYASPWREIAVLEAVERAGEDGVYARSPRSTPGATRA